ncbi:MAG: hypothetical protein V2A79_10275 [Planctomycetota bacterium]
MTRTAKVQMPETQYSNSWEAEFTAEQIETLMLRLQQAGKSLEGPPIVFCVGDYGYSPVSGFWLVKKGEPAPEVVYDYGGARCLFPCDRATKKQQRLGNLFDLLTEGPILVGLTEDEAARRFEAAPSRQQKMQAALDRYRAAQKKEDV